MATLVSSSRTGRSSMPMAISVDQLPDQGRAEAGSGGRHDQEPFFFDELRPGDGLDADRRSIKFQTYFASPGLWALDERSTSRRPTNGHQSSLRCLTHCPTWPEDCLPAGPNWGFYRTKNARTCCRQRCDCAGTKSTKEWCTSNASSWSVPRAWALRSCRSFPGSASSPGIQISTLGPSRTELVPPQLVKPALAVAKTPGSASRTMMDCSALTRCVRSPTNSYAMPIQHRHLGSTTTRFSVRSRLWVPWCAETRHPGCTASSRMPPRSSHPLVKAISHGRPTPRPVGATGSCVTDRGNRAALWAEIQQGRLRQGWGWADDQDLRELRRVALAGGTWSELTERR